MSFVPPTFIASCDTCGCPLDTCAKRPGGRKYDTGNGWRCFDCQDAAGDEPRYDKRYST